jgi:hypothetical protein
MMAFRKKVRKYEYLKERKRNSWVNMFPRACSLQKEVLMETWQ